MPGLVRPALFGAATRAALDEGIGIYPFSALRPLVSGVVIVGVFLILRRPLPWGLGLRVVGGIMGVFNLAIPSVLFTLAFDNASVGFVGIVVRCCR